MANRFVATALSLTLLACAAPVAAQPSNLSDGSNWDLTQVYPDAASAERERVAVGSALSELAQYKSHLGDSPRTLLAALELRTRLLKRVRTLYLYALLKVSEDVRVPSAQALRASAGRTVADFQSAIAYFDPEIVAMGRARIEQFEATDPSLGRFRRPLELVLRHADHVLAPDAEAVLGAASVLTRAPSTVHVTLSNADMPWPTVVLHGTPTRLDRVAYRAAMRDPDRATRKAAFEAYTGALSQFRNTQAALVQAHVNGAAYEAKLRAYPSSAAFLLADDAMPPDAFDAMSRAADEQQPTIDRYLRLRAQAIGIDRLHSYDFGVPLAQTTTRYPLVDGEALVLKALAPLGPDYVAQLTTGFGEHRMNWLPSPGKSPEARTVPFNNGLAPMVLLSYTGDAESVFILAHEWGHAMHMQLSASAQPYETADASVFVLDAPSLLNEMLVNDYMVAHAASLTERVAALSEAIETLRRTYYQVLPMMRVEMAERAAADRGEPLTADSIGKMSCDALRQFNGADRGASVVDPGACSLWTVSQEPYDNLYFYKYLNAVSAAAYFAEAIESREPGAFSRYFVFLRAGGSEDPYLLLKAAGFDARDPEAYTAMGRRFKNDVDQLETALQAMDKHGASSSR